MESPNRLEQTLQLLSKLGIVELQMVQSDTDPEAPDELGFVHFHDVEILKGFYKYFFSIKGTSIEEVLKNPPAPEESDKQAYHDILKEIRMWNAMGKLEGVPVIEAQKEAQKAKAAA